jgi:hypothetical protein
MDFTPTLERSDKTEDGLAALTSIFGMGPFRLVACPPPGCEDRQLYHGARINVLHKASKMICFVAGKV